VRKDATEDAEEAGVSFESGRGPVARCDFRGRPAVEAVAREAVERTLRATECTDTASEARDARL
jgi:hypothetical protein